jgi:hypothetical protein
MAQAKTNADEINWDMADSSAQDFKETYPRIQWVNGSKKLKNAGGMAHTGGLFIPEEQYVGFDAPDWKRDTLVTQKGEEIPGHYSNSAAIAIICVKEWWEQSTPPKSHYQAMVRIKGRQDLFNLSLSGKARTQPFKTIVSDHSRKIVATLNNARPAGKDGFQNYALWTVIVPSAHETIGEGNKAYEVTVPKLFVPEVLDLAYVKSLWVGGDNLTSFTQNYHNLREWVRTVPQNVDNASNDRGWNCGDGLQGQYEAKCLYAAKAGIDIVTFEKEVEENYQCVLQDLASDSMQQVLGALDGKIKSYLALAVQA